MTVKVRIAPSPTGNLHVGTAQSALFNWLFARRHGGQFIVRIDDTDKERSKPEYEENIVGGLKWLGLDWDNAETIRQSERTAIYRDYLQKLLDGGKAFWREYTNEEKQAMEKEGRAARDRVIVLKDDGDPEREVAFDDIIRGRVSVLAKNIGQLVIAKSLDEPLYHFASVVDDIDLGMTHILRGEDHISNTPKQMLIAEALGSKLPQFAHLPLMLGTDRSKLSKRNGSVNMDEYRKDYLPEALINFLGALSYTFEPELLTRDEMVAQFDLARVHKSGAIFDVTKLNWFNTQYIKRLPPAAFKKLVDKPDLPDAAVPLMTERLEKFSDITQFAYLWEDSAYDAELLQWKDDDTATTLKALHACALLAEKNSLTTEQLDQAAIDDFGGKKGSIYWPLRVALSGRRNSAGPLEIAGAIGAESTRRRIAAAIKKING